jgi:hypothetical protein
VNLRRLCWNSGAIPAVRQRFVPSDKNHAAILLLFDIIGRMSNGYCVLIHEVARPIRQ